MMKQMHSPCCSLKTNCSHSHEMATHLLMKNPTLSHSLENLVLQRPSSHYHLTQKISRMAVNIKQLDINKQESMGRFKKALTTILLIRTISAVSSTITSASTVNAFTICTCELIFSTSLSCNDHINSFSFTRSTKVAQ